MIAIYNRNGQQQLFTGLCVTFHYVPLLFAEFNFLFTCREFSALNTYDNLCLRVKTRLSEKHHRLGALPAQSHAYRVLNKEVSMRNGIGPGEEDEIQGSITKNISHNLEIAEKCLKCLLNMLAGDAGERPRNHLIADEPDYENILELCASTAQLIEDLHDLLRDGATLRKSANGDYTLRAKIGGNGELPEPANEVEDNHDLNKQFREGIVDLMILSVQCWEQCTKKNKIELAEESNIWRINVDGGRLRVRSMDRYLGVNKLPKVPRWHDVLKTAYFVLDTVKCDLPIKKKLEESLDRMLWIMRKRSLK